MNIGTRVWTERWRKWPDGSPFREVKRGVVVALRGGKAKVIFDGWGRRDGYWIPVLCLEEEEEEENA